MEGRNNGTCDARVLSTASPKSRIPPGAIPRRVNFVLGGLAGWVVVIVTSITIPCYLNRMTATVFVQPLDLVKNRMQLSGKCTNHILNINIVAYGSGTI